MAQHHHHGTANERSLKWAIFLNVLITLSQVIGGLWISSMALITDALHNFMDVAALIISLVAIQLSKKPQSLKRSFGYKRAETVAALINSISIVVVAIIILAESARRLQSPEMIPINGMIVVYLAGLGVLVNGFSAALLHRGSKESMNMRSAFLHLLSDTLFSVAVAGGGLCIHYLGIYWIDSVLSVIIALYLIYSSWPVISRGLKIIMQFSPDRVDVRRIKEEVERLEGIINLHHVHVWELDEHRIHLEAHVEMEPELNLKEVCGILRKADSLLRDEFNISHSTLQPESGRCENQDLLHEDH